MTTLIGVQYENGCLIVADSRTTDDSGKIYSHPDVKKIEQRGQLLVSGSGEVLPCDILQHIWEPPQMTKADRADVYHYMVAKAMPSLRKCLIENGFNFDEPKTDTRFQFLIAANGELFDIDDELSVSRNDYGFYGAGSGGPYALGALLAGKDAYEAMEIAAKATAFTAPPYISKEQFKTY